MISISILFILLSNAVTLRRDISIIFNRIAILVLIYCILQDLTSLSVITKDISLHGNLLHKTNISQIFNIFIFIVSILILQLTSFYPKKLVIYEHSIKNINVFKNSVNTFTAFFSKIMNNFNINEHLKIIEYPLIILFIIMGAIFLMAANDLISIFLAIELQSYGLYLLSTIYRNSELATTGGLMYFLLGGLSSCFILLGTSLLYINSGITNLDSLYILLNIVETNNIWFWYSPHYVHFGFLIISLGFLFKVSAAPFHFWSPDVYDAIPTIVTTFVAIISKISIFIFLFGLVYYTKNSYSFTDNKDISWTYSLLFSSFFSLIIGTIVGLTQFRIKRLFAYSTISHIGFILLALAISSIESTQAFMFYLMQYSITNLNVFFIIIAIGFSLSIYISDNKEHEKLLDKNNSPVQLINQLRGYFFVNPILAISLIITIFSFMGIPPLIGFFGKQMVLSAALDKGFIFLTLIAITTSVIGGVYYLNIVKEVFFYNSQYKLNPLFQVLNIPLRKMNNSNKFYMNINIHNFKLSSSISATISIITWIIILFMFFNKEWLSMGTILVQTIFNT